MDKSENRPQIICLCGSTKFKKQFEAAAEKLTLEGKIVLTVGVFGNDPNCKVNISDEVKEKLDKLHLAKIDISDEILVINCNKYIGNSTRKEIEYAKRQGKKVNYLEQ